jgi:hypothetical protein
MHTVMESCKREGVASEVWGKERPSCTTTTLCECVTVLQDMVNPDNDPLVVTTVVHLLRSGQLRRLVGGTRKCLPQRPEQEWTHILSGGVQCSPC